MLPAARRRLSAAESSAASSPPRSLSAQAVTTSSMPYRRAATIRQPSPRHSPVIRSPGPSSRTSRTGELSPPKCPHTAYEIQPASSGATVANSTRESMLGRVANAVTPSWVAVKTRPIPSQSCCRQNRCSSTASNANGGTTPAWTSSPRSSRRPSPVGPAGTSSPTGRPTDTVVSGPSLANADQRYPAGSPGWLTSSPQWSPPHSRRTWPDDTSPAVSASNPPRRRSRTCTGNGRSANQANMASIGDSLHPQRTPSYSILRRSIRAWSAELLRR
jgi:hypothetical protein